AAGRVSPLAHPVGWANGPRTASAGECGPTALLFGAGQLFPALEDRLAGMTAGETRELRIPAEDAYGAWRPELVRTMPRDRLPPDLDLRVGEDYRLTAPDGTALRFRLLALGEGGIQADLNPPAAGEELLATVTVVDVRPATADEERRGRVWERRGAAAPGASAGGSRPAGGG